MPAEPIMVEVVCERCKGERTVIVPQIDYSRWDCPDCKGTGTRTATLVAGSRAALAIRWAEAVVEHEIATMVEYEAAVNSVGDEDLAQLGPEKQALYRAATEAERECREVFLATWSRAARTGEGQRPKNAVEARIAGLSHADAIKALDGRCAYCGGTAAPDAIYCHGCAAARSGDDAPNDSPKQEVP